MSNFSQALVNQLVGFGQTAVRVAARPAGPVLPHINDRRNGNGRKPSGNVCTPCAAAKMVRDARKQFGR